MIRRISGSRARVAWQKHEVSGDFHWLPATFDGSVSATQLAHKRFGDFRVPQPCLWVSNSKHVKSFCLTRSFTAVRHLDFTVVDVVRMCYHALSQWTCVLHGYFAWLYAQNSTQIIPPLSERKVSPLTPAVKRISARLLLPGDSCLATD